MREPTQQEIIAFCIGKTKEEKERADILADHLSKRTRERDAAIAETDEAEAREKKIALELQETHQLLELAETEINDLKKQLSAFTQAAPLSAEQKGDLAQLGFPGLAN